MPVVVGLGSFGEIFQCASSFTFVCQGQCYLHRRGTSSMLLCYLPLLLGKKSFSDHLRIVNDFNGMAKEEKESFQSLAFKLSPVVYGADL